MGNSVSCPFGFYRDPRQPQSCRACPCDNDQGCSVVPGGEEVICDQCPLGAAGNALLQVASALPFSRGSTCCIGRYRCQRARMLGPRQIILSSQPGLPMALPLLPVMGCFSLKDCVNTHCLTPGKVLI